MKSLAIAVILGTVSLATGEAANASEALAKSSGCLTCHAADTKKVGPSFKETAAKFKGKADAEASLVAKLKAGTGHPAAKASEEDLKTVVKWILAM